MEAGNQTPVLEERNIYRLLAAELSFQPRYTHSYSDLSRHLSSVVTACLQCVLSVGVKVLIRVRTWVYLGAESKDCWGAAPVSPLQ